MLAVCVLLLLGVFFVTMCTHTGFDVNFPVIAKDPVVAAAVGYTGRNFLADSVDITRWYNRATKVITGSVIFSSGCEGPPGEVQALCSGVRLIFPTPCVVYVARLASFRAKHILSYSRRHPQK